MITDARRRTDLRPVRPDDDAALVRGWLAGPRAAFWRMGHLDVDQVRDYLAEITADPDQDAWLGTVDGRPSFLAETYDPARVLLAGRYDARPGDLGMHVLIAPPDGPPSHGFTGAVFAAVMRWCFGRLRAERVVVEPDTANTKIIAMNARAGFRVVREFDVPEGEGIKRAALSICTEADFDASSLGRTS
jgi:RimJ/RimL family protein N-acetyltransferase